MTGVGSVYGEALYTLAADEQLDEQIGEELSVLDQSFRQEPDFIRLLSSPNFPRQERCRILDDSFRGKIHPYVLNFLKILTEKGYMRQFSQCCKAYTDLFNQAHGLLPVTAITAVPLSAQQEAALKEKLSRITGKQIKLQNKVDTGCLGGVRLDFDGKRLDDTVAHRLAAISNLLRDTVL